MAIKVGHEKGCGGVPGVVVGSDVWYHPGSLNINWNVGDYFMVRNEFDWRSEKNLAGLIEISDVWFRTGIKIII